VTAVVLLSVIFFARRDEFPSRGLGHLWGRFLTCGGLAIRLPRSSEKPPVPFAACRYALQDGILRGGGQSPLSLYSASFSKFAETDFARIGVHA
jgi:hypothetical protein